MVEPIPQWMKPHMTREELRRHQRSIPKCASPGCREQRLLESELCRIHFRAAEAQREADEALDDLHTRISMIDSLDDVRTLLHEIADRLP